MRIPAFLVAALAATSVASAQLQPPPFLPRDCENAARQSTTLADVPDAVLNGIVTIGADVPIGQLSVTVGMSMADGRSEAWGYTFYSAEADTTVLVSMIRLALQCTAVPIPYTPSPNLLGTVPVPPNYLQGAGLITALESNALYRDYHTAYPDSVPNVVALSSARETNSVVTADVHYWYFLFNRPSQSSMTCYTHATDGTTTCFDGIPSSVASADAVPGTGIAPNPAHTSALLGLPTAWSGRRVDIVVVDAVGNEVHSLSVVATVPSVLLPLQSLAAGSYTVRMASRGDVVALPLTVVR